jgi:SAM-dependent methyltransferase
VGFNFFNIIEKEGPVPMSTHQTRKMSSKYAPLIGIDQYGSGEKTEELQFWNYGYWHMDTPDPKAASLNLLDKLVAMLPRPPAKVLDVAFGQGGSLKKLCEIYGSANVSGINIAENQILHAKKSGLTCDLKLMDAGRLEFSNASFDGILCMEAAFHFKSRLSFLKRAHNALKPGGKLIMSDLLFRSSVGLDQYIFPPENCVGSIDEYRAVFKIAGFQTNRTKICVTTNEQLVPFIAKTAEYAGYLPFPDPDKINISAAHSQHAILFILTRLLNISECVTVCAERE